MTDDYKARGTIEKVFDDGKTTKDKRPYRRLQLGGEYYSYFGNQQLNEGMEVEVLYRMSGKYRNIRDLTIMTAEAESDSPETSLLAPESESPIPPEGPVSYVDEWNRQKMRMSAQKSAVSLVIAAASPAKAASDGSVDHAEFRKTLNLFADETIALSRRLERYILGLPETEEDTN